MLINNIIVKIPITRKNFASTNSAKFKGELQVVANAHGIIKDWKVNFTEVHIDLLTTPRWFVEKNTIFSIRERLFSELGLTQKQRPSKSLNDTVKLDSSQLVKLNNFLNDRTKYASTIKNIVGVIKGSNPGGEAKNPSSAEMIIDEEKSNIKNFVILFDDLMFKYNNYFEAYAINAKSVSLEEFASINLSLKNAFEFMQKSKDKNGFKLYLEQVKNYYKAFNDWSKQGNQIAEIARRKYTKNVRENINREELPFEFTTSKQFQSCHIYEFYVLRDKIIEALIDSKEKDVKKYESMIYDYENFLPLPEEIHRQFDRHIFTYNPDGTIQATNQEGQEFINNYVAEKFRKIPDNFLTKQRVFYIKQRNEI